MRKSLIIFLALALSIGSKAQDAWKIEAKEPHKSLYYGTSVGNGMIGIVSSAEPMKTSSTVLTGVYDKSGRGRTSNFLPSFNLLDLKLTLDWQDITADNITDYKQELDMKTGIFRGSFQFKDIARVEYSYTALRHLPHTTMMEVSVTPSKDIHIVAENRVEVPSLLKDAQLLKNEINPSHAYIPLLTTIAKSPTGKTEIVASNTFAFPDKLEEKPRVMYEMRDSNAHLAKFVKKIKGGKTYTFALIGSLISSVQTADPHNQAERLTIRASLEGTDILWKKHKSAWAELWTSDIQIEGDKQAQQDIHNMLYHLYAFTRAGSKHSLSPMGLSGLGYNGHTFWDTEIWMYPTLLVLHPELARGLLEYRYDRLEKAIENAQMNGYHGAMYPWESADSGEEETPVWALSGTFEHHITADVAIATWQYYQVTKDEEWLREKGWKILEQTAKFWASRVDKNGDKYEIRNVVGSDEWAENVNNDAYTNATAKLNLEYAIEAAKILNINLMNNWKEIADNLVFSKMENRVTREHDSYKGENIKQADVNLLAYPLKVITDKEQIKRDLNYYQHKVPTSETPAMTQAMFALIYSRLGDADNAYHYFKDAYEPNLLPPFRVMAETKGGTNPYFITGAGGVLQTVMMGFIGLDITDNGIVQINSAIPKHWKKISILVGGNERKIFTKNK